MYEDIRMDFLDSFWRSISRTGIDPNSGHERNRHIILCNKVASILSGLTLIISLISFLYFGFILSVVLAFGAAFVFLIPILLNYWGDVNGSRLFLSTSLSIAAIGISILDKFDDFDKLEEFQYYHFRLMLLAASLFPFILFKLEEKRYWVTASIVNAACIIFYDPIHELFRVGYYQVGFHAPHYYFLNYMVIATALVLAGSTYFLKFSFEKTEQKNEVLIKNLSKANQVIRQQQSLLALENVQLSRDLLEKNKQLTETNEELVRHNSELHQFSYTVSHNLRGPVASLGGLLGIFNPHDLNPENQELLAHLKKSHQSLENTIRDLSHIIDIRNNLSGIRQKIVLREELEHAKVLLEKEITDHRADIEANFSVPEIYAAKHMIDSILYNLISNAVKYRSPDRKPHIIVSSSKEGDRVVLTAEDNGLGLDIDKYKEKLFGLYKRFHSHTDGRGLGLFLVKLQTQAMGGTIEVQSKVGIGTIFRIILPAHDIQGEQILRDDPSARLYFDASLDAVVIHWKTKVTEEAYREFLSEAVNFIRAFQTSNWISNLSEVISRDEESLNSFRTKVRSELKQAGLKHIAVIMPKTNYPDYEDRTRAMKKVYDADVEFFDTLEEGREWIIKQNRISWDQRMASAKS